MLYDFSNTKLEIEDFIDANTSCVIMNTEAHITTTTGFYETIFSIFKKPFEEEELLNAYTNLTTYKLEEEIPYSIMSNEIYGLKNLLITNLNPQTLSEDIIKLLSIFKKINDRVAYLYLLQYTNRLISLNNIRLGSISDLIEKNIIVYYESHLEWLTSLAKHIQDADTKSFPEISDSVCEFGKWLHSDAKQIISNNSKHKNLMHTHRNLHLLASKILNIIKMGEYHALITYLEKCELISLSIGTELALLDQILINKKITKDALTGALNRHGLKSVFESQYEFSLATSNPFILAMCDLDFFKNVNDTYGHVAGDKLLKLFVDTAKENIRNSDVIIRYGGEEFVIVLPTINKRKGFEVLDNIRQKFEKVVLEFDGKKISATVSIGMIEVEPDHLFKQSFLDKYLMLVDEELYLAKEHGRNRVEA